MPCHRTLASGDWAIGSSCAIVRPCAAHSREDLEFAIRAFADVKRELSL
jgi:hypothetical protein